MNDDLGDRMKEYESIPRARLVRQLPVLMRLDGKAFHTLTRGLKKPVDEGFQEAMWEAATQLCEEVQGARLAYTWSDEIQLLLVDYESFKTQPWFEYEIQKMCSVAASIATQAFSQRFGFLHPEKQGARCYFDCRVWNLPPAEVCNAFIWRQQDASRNSVSCLAQTQFSHKELHGKNGSEMQEMLHSRGINWNNCPTSQRRGVCVVKETYTTVATHGVAKDAEVERTRWVVDQEIPIFTQDRSYIDRHVYPLTSAK